jgi:CRISPR-associated endonuclease/helicase Cas3
MLQASLTLHHNHHLHDPKKGTEISFGVIRFANIDPCVAFAKYLSQSLLPPDTEIRVMVYHSRQTLLLRHEQERYLDGILKRHAENPQNPVILTDPLIRKLIDDTHASKILFIVVCSPVEEVGRDHDYDWAVVEPSSWRSIIQMSGRVNRHRQMVITTPNVAIMQYNFKCFKAKDKKYNCKGKQQLYYINPGYEVNDPPMTNHDLSILLSSWNGVINAGDRLALVNDYKSQKNGDNGFAWYEHKVINRLLLNKYAPDSMVNYPVNYWDLSAITQNLSEFRKSYATINLTLRNCSQQNETDFSFCVQDTLKNWIKVENIYKINNISLQDMRSFGGRIWLMRDYRATVEKYAEHNDLHPNEVMNRFGSISMPDNTKVKWNYSDIFGMYKETNEDFWDD